MSYARRIVRCTECEKVMTAKTDGDGNQYLMGTNECPRCGCEGFEIVEIDEHKSHTTAADD